jgi:hypothetical protein
MNSMEKKICPARKEPNPCTKYSSRLRSRKISPAMQKRNPVPMSNASVLFFIKRIQAIDDSRAGTALIR